MTATAIQAPALQADVQVQPQAVKPSQSFKDIMQAAQSQQSQQAQTPQKTPQQTPKADTNVRDTAKDAGTRETQTQQTSETQGLEVKTAETVEGVIAQASGEARADSLRVMFVGLFGVGVSGVDFTQSDGDILKDLLKQCRDPEQQFAVMLMMAFLEANPDYKLEDLAGEIENCPNKAAETGSSPVAAVMNAIERMMAKDESIQDFPLLGEAHALLKADVPQKSQFLQMMEELNVQTVSYTKSSEGQVQEEEPETALLMQGKLRTAVEQAKQALANSKNQGGKTDIDHLQQQVDSGQFLRGFNVFQGARTAQAIPMPTGAEFVQQVRTGILENLEDAQTEFLMRLKPDGLGELTVKLTEAAGKMTLTITAASQQTQRLLEAQLPNLREVMKPYEVEVGSIIQGKDDAAARFGGAFGQQFGGHGQEAMEREQGGRYVFEDAGDEPEEIPPEYLGEETLNTYI